MQLVGDIPALDPPAEPRVGTGTVTVTFHLASCTRPEMQQVARSFVEKVVESSGYSATDAVVENVGWYAGKRPSQR